GRGEAQLEAGMALYQSAKLAACVSSSAENAGASVIIHRLRIVIHRPAGGVKGAAAAGLSATSAAPAPAEARRFCEGLGEGEGGGGGVGAAGGARALPGRRGVPGPP